MKLYTLWDMAGQMVRRHYFLYMISVTLSVVSFLLFSITYFAYVLTGYGRSRCEDILVQGIEKTGVFAFQTEKTDGWSDFIKDVNELEQVDAAVYTQMGISIPNSEEIREIQRNTDLPSGISEEEIYTLVSTPGLFDLFELRFEEGCYRESTEEITYIYLGADFSGIPVGTVYKDDEHIYEVAGILKKNMEVLNIDLMFRESDLMELDYCINVDNMVICCDDEVMTNWCIFSSNGEWTEPEAFEAIKNVGEAYHMELDGASVENELYVREVDNKKIFNLARNMLIWILLFAATILACIQIMDTLDSIEEYGILYANGCSSGDVIGMNICGNIRRIWIALILWYAIAWLGCKYMIIPYYESMFSLRSDLVMLIFYKSICPVVVLFAVAYLICNSIIPVAFTHRLSPAALIGGFRS